MKMLLAQGGNVQVHDARGRTSLLVAAYRGHITMVHWLLVEGCASIKDIDEHGQTVWTFIKRRVQTAAAAELSALLRVMVLMDDAPPAFRPYTESVPIPEMKVKVEHARIIAQGMKLRARLPYYKQQQRSLLAAKSRLPNVLLSIVIEYATPTTDDIWEEGWLKGAGKRDGWVARRLRTFFSGRKAQRK
jgi:hypothetical protein